MSAPINSPLIITKVHHINGQGEDSGVVYSEMQGRENTSGDLMALRCVSPQVPHISHPDGATGLSNYPILLKARIVARQEG